MSSYLLDPFALPFMARALAELVLLGALAGVVGVFVLVRQLAFVADTLTHTVFPGVVIGFLLGGEGGVFWGALLAGAATAVLLTLLTRGRRVSEDAALAVLLTALFSVGVVITSRRTSYTADLENFLFGQVLTVTPGEIAQTAVVAAVVLVALALLGKEFVLRAFDPQAARSQGYRVGLLDLALNALVALVVVAAVRSVGTVLVIALLVLPAAVGRAVSGRIPVIAAVGALVGAAGGYLGLVASYRASVDHGVLLASGATVVLALVAIHLVVLAGTGLARLAGRRADRSGAVQGMPATRVPAPHHRPRPDGAVDREAG